MISLHSFASSRPLCKPLAVCIAALFGLPAFDALAAGNTWNVTSCNDDSDAGTLRNVIAAPTTMSDDVVDLSGLACSTITLAAGATSIAISQLSLRIQNTGPNHITIDGFALKDGETDAADSRIFSHDNPGRLTIQGVTLTGGHVFHSANRAVGGCIRSLGDVELIDSTVSSCSAYSGAPAEDAYPAIGGGIFALSTVTLTRSTVSGNAATSANFEASGGGIFAYGGVTSSYSSVTGNTAKSSARGAYGGGIRSGGVSASYSTISGNSALGSSGYGAGGAIYTAGSVTLRKSTISNNHSSAAIGGIAAFATGLANANEFYMTASTVSGNSSGGLVGGIGVNSSTVKIYNSTIAFNSAYEAQGNGKLYGPGLALNPFNTAMAVTLSSNLMSNNTYASGTIELDLTTANAPPNALTFNASPANNFIRVSIVAIPPASQLPDDTLSAPCPLLGPLRDNGGPTLTHALLSGSIAIDHGNNAKNYDEDQRGLDLDSQPFPYPRISGLFADIGAYEVNQSDIVFNGGFDGCPDLLSQSGRAIF